MITHDAEWMAQQIGKTADWVSRNRSKIPHHRIGGSLRFTDEDLAAYLRSTAVPVTAMRTTGRRRTA